MDDLLGLDLSKQSPTSSQPRPPPVKGNPSYGRSTFDYLSAAQPTTRTPSPSLQRVPSPFAPPAAPRPPPTSTAAGANLRPTKGGGNDAFSSLFGGSAGSSAASAGGLSMAERLAKESGTRNGGNGNESASGMSWTALSPASTGGSGSRAPSPAFRAPLRAGSLNTLARGASPAPRTAAAPDPWDFDLLAPTTSTSSKPTSPTPNALDPFSLEFDSPTSAPPAPAAATTSAPDEFDLLGLLSAPLSSLPPRPSPRPSPSPSPALSSRASPRPSPSRASSPPPHVLGQMVEMGFSVSQARIALVATIKEGGQWDVEGALEVLVEEGQREDLRVQVEEEEQGLSGKGRERSRRRSWEEEPVVVELPRVGRRAREAAEREKVAGGREDAAAKVQEQAAELLAQASKIGLSVFKSANAYWETGRATIQKALDEKMATEEGEAGAKKGKERERREVNGRTRPKWMTEDVRGEEGEEPRARETESKKEGKRREASPPRPLFQDSDEEVVDDVLPQRPVVRNDEERKPRPPAPSASSRPPPAAEPAADYRSPWRRPKPSSTPEPASRPPPPSASAQRPPPSERPPATARPTPAPKPTRPPRVLIPASPAQLASSTTHKAKGNDFFKLGRFGDAEQSYSLAIAALPSSHLALIPLLNNRANARLRVGDEKGAAEDCSSVVALVLGPTRSVERLDLAALEAESAELGDVNLKEQLSKALGRRAKAYEATERWTKALEDWSAVMQGGEAFARGAGGTKLASEGLARCRKMLGGESSGATKAPVVAKPTRRTAPVVAAKPVVVVVASGEAVKALRTANDAADAEDDLRLSLKDAVDAKLFAWKGGKEANLRALIASLDNVLWPELEWKKVGMHELISEGQLKVRYVRAIGKLHPDKLNVGNTTVEQRMIAGAVFSALNDAWNASKA